MANGPRRGEDVDDDTASPAPVAATRQRMLDGDVNLELTAIHHDGQALVEAARSAPDAPVPSCPGWTMTDLIGHASGAHRWASHVVTQGDESQPRILPEPPAELADLLAWYDDGLAELEAILAATDPEAPVWTPTTGTTGSVWWRRKMAVETALHRWDAEHAAAQVGGPRPAPVDDGVAAAGIEEYLTEFLDGMLMVAGDARPTGTACLAPVDRAERWWLDLDRVGSGSASTAAASPVDATVNATASDLLLWIWNRLPDPLASLQVEGRREIVLRWAAMRI